MKRSFPLSHPRLRSIHLGLDNKIDGLIYAGDISANWDLSRYASNIAIP